MIPLRVLKIGGSLFRHPWLPTALLDWSRQEGRCVNIVISGGGPWADDIRDLESKGQLSNEQAHWCAIRTMGWSSIWLASRVAESQQSTSILDLTTISKGVIPSFVFFDPFLWMSEVEPHLPGPKLPIGWQTTSDSIAARLAGSLEVELVVLKSAPFDFATISDAVAAGYIDESFAEIVSPKTSVRFIDFPQWNTLAQH